MELLRSPPQISEMDLSFGGSGGMFPGRKLTSNMKTSHAKVSLSCHRKIKKIATKWMAEPIDLHLEPTSQRFQS